MILEAPVDMALTTAVLYLREGIHRKPTRRWGDINDALRVNGQRERAKIVDEGGNLGFSPSQGGCTQRGYHQYRRH